MTYNPALEKRICDDWITVLSKITETHKSVELRQIYCVGYEVDWLRICGDRNFGGFVVPIANLVRDVLQTC